MTSLAATTPMCAHCVKAKATVIHTKAANAALRRENEALHAELKDARVDAALRKENERLRAELVDWRKEQRRREERARRVPEVSPRSGWDLVMELKDRGLRVVDRDPRGATAAWRASCPAHEDRHEALSVTELQGGKVLLKCFAGCETEQVLDAIGWTLPMLRGAY